MAQVQTIPGQIIPFVRNQDVDEDQDGSWVFFDVTHDGGVHDLFMAYEAESSRPLRVKIGEVEMWVSVAFGKPTSASVFLKEGTFDLGEAGTTRVGFKAVQEWPDIRAFSFVPEQHKSRSRRLHSNKSYFGNTSSDHIGKDMLQRSIRWNQSPTAITFSFEFGSENVGTDYEYQSISLQGKSVKFTYGEAHDCMTLNGDPIGDQYGGENFPEVTRIGEADVISSLALGLSTYNGEAAFHSIALQDQKTKQNKQRILVGSVLQEPTWIYDREKLGLNLWITSVCAPSNRPIARYGFTLSSDPTIDFDEKEFLVFWRWLVDIKSRTSKRRLTAEQVDDKMSPLRTFLIESFSNSTVAHVSRNEGWLYGTRYHVSLTYDVFSLLLCRMPGSDELKITFFLDGIQYDSSRFSRLEDVPLFRNDILAYAISSAAQDTDLLYQMGLFRKATPGADGTSKERELQPLLESGNLFSGDYKATPFARRAMVILAMAGLRKAGSTILTEESEGWDVYTLSAQKRGKNHPLTSYFMLTGASFVCMLVQTLIPILLCYRAITEEDSQLTWDTYCARIFFLFYAAFAEASSWGLDREERVVAWLCFFPEFSVKRLVWGRVINQASRIMTTVATIGLIQNSFTVFDVTLNSLALYYILNVDDDLVSTAALERIRNHQEEAYVTIKAKMALKYREPWFEDMHLPRIQELPSRYFLLVSRRIGHFSLLMLCGAIIYAIFVPWFVSKGGFDHER